MAQLLSLVLISFGLTSLLLVPFINLLYFFREKRGKNASLSSAISEDTPIHHKLLAGKDNTTPVGGGLLVIAVVVLLTLLVVYFTNFTLDKSLIALLLALLSFGAIGALDDYKKIFTIFEGKFRGIRGRVLLVLELIAATLVALFLYFGLGFNNLFIPIFGNIVLGIWYIPIAIFTIVAFANAFNISDGLDGLSTGLLTICLFAFLVLAFAVFNPSLSIFVGIWIGALIAYLYFNVFPARIYLGDAGAFGFGATLAVVGLLTGKILGLAIIGGMYVIIVTSSLIQILSKRFLKRKVFPVAPLHMYFKYIGWEEPKIVTRFWLAGAIFAIFGLWLALLSN